MRHSQIFSFLLLRSTSLLSLIFLLFGCAFISQRVHLTPMVIVQHPDIGQGRKVQVVVVDQRVEKTLGHRAIMGGVGVITLAEDPQNKFKKDLENMLIARGFMIIDQAGPSDGRVVLTINAITYRMDAKVVAITISTEANLGIEVMKGIINNYSQTYRAANEIAMIMAPTARENEHFINETIAQTFMQIANDGKLFDALSQ